MDTQTPCTPQRHRFLAVLLSLSVLLAVPIVQATAGSHEGPGSPGKGRDLAFRGGTSDETWAELRAAAERDGQVDVVVALDIETRPEGHLGKAERKGQRQKIRRHRENLARKLTQHGSTVTDGFDEVPFLYATVNTRGLDVLRRSKIVSGVDEIAEHELDPIDIEPVVDGDVTPDAGNEDPAGANGPAANVYTKGYGDNWWHYWATNLDDSRGKGYTGRGQTVVVVDTGVDSDHPWLAGDVAAEACFVSTGGCPGGRTYAYGPGAAKPCTFHRDCNHGTHVAHLAAGKYGTASDAKIAAVQVFRRGSNGRPTYTSKDVVLALWYTNWLRSQKRVAAVNLSLGTRSFYTRHCDGSTEGYSLNGHSIEAWISYLRSYRVATVIASGNYGTASYGIGSPACSRSAIPVGNTAVAPNGAEGVYADSQAAPIQYLVAPGTDIVSAIPSPDNTPRIGRMTGTSMAAPQVAGAFAVLKQLEPSASVQHHYNALWSGGVGIRDDRDGRVRARLDVWKALVWAYQH